MPKYKVHRGSFSLKVNGQKPPTIYHRGEVFESPRTDLEARNNRPGYPVRLERVPDDTPVTPAKAGIRARAERKASDEESATPAPAAPPRAPSDSYDAMTVGELKAHAAAEEIGLGEARSKAEIIAVLRSHDAAGA